MDLEKLEETLDNKLKLRNVPIGNIFDKNNKIEVVNEGYDKNPGNLYIRNSTRCFIEDYSNNRYIDTSLGAGTHILGHGFIGEVIGDQLKNGTLFTVPSAYPYEVATVINKMVGHLTHFVFCNSGAEATMRAVRIARAFTKKNKIALFSGGWHGGNDMLMFDDDPASPCEHPSAMFKSAGTPEELLGTVILLPYNSPEALNIIKNHAHELAMVIVEPSQGSNPRADMAGFLTELREVTAKNDVLLCFDEIITGFRVQAGGCQEHYNIKADLVTYGKTVGGGLPVGVVGGGEAVMGVVKGTDNQKPAFMGGTFSANPMVMCAARAVLNRLNDQKEVVYPELNENGQRIRDVVNQFCISSGIPVRMMGIGSMSRIYFTDREIKSRRDRDRYELNQYIQNVFFKFLLLERDVFVNKNRIMFLSTTHTREVVDHIANAIVDALDFFRAGGCFSGTHFNG